MPPRAHFFLDHRHAPNHPMGRTFPSEEMSVSPSTKQHHIEVKKSVSFNNTVGVICPRHCVNKKACWYNAQEYADMRQANYDTVVLASQQRRQDTQQQQDCTRGLEKVLQLYHCNNDRDANLIKNRRQYAIQAVLKEQERQWKTYGQVVYPSMLAKVSQKHTASQQNKAIAMAACDAVNSSSAFAPMEEVVLHSPPPPRNNNGINNTRRRIVAVFEESSSSPPPPNPQPPKRQQESGIQRNQHIHATKRRNSSSNRVLLLDNIVARVFCSSSSSPSTSCTTKGVC